MREPESPIFDGGYIVVQLEGMSLESARGSNLEIFVMRGGEEVVRKAGSESTPSFPGINGLWSSISIVPLKKPLETEHIDFYVVFEALEKSDHFRIHA